MVLARALWVLSLLSRILCIGVVYKTVCAPERKLVKLELVG